MPEFEREIEIDAPVEEVWEVMTDPRRWPEWFPGMDRVSGIRSVREGEHFEWGLGDRSGTGTVAEMEPMKRLEITTRIGDDRDAHAFRLRRSGGFFGLAADECKVEYTLDTLEGGGILKRFVTAGNPRDAMRVKKAVHRLRRTVEGT